MRVARERFAPRLAIADNPFERIAKANCQYRFRRSAIE
jgi:histone H3/H4